MLERDMRLAVCRWLNEQGFMPCLEVYTLNNCDIVGVRFEGRIAVDAVAVELKLKDVLGVLSQCRSHVLSGRVSRVYAGMPLAMGKRAKDFADAGIGLLLVDGDAVSVRVESPAIASPYVKRLSNQWRRRGEWVVRSENAGMCWRRLYDHVTVKGGAA